MTKLAALSISLLILGQSLTAQDNPGRELVQVMSQQSFVLNGGLKASFDGKSRTYYPIKLPENTVEWYYSFTTTSIGGNQNNLELLTQLSNLIDPSGITSIAVTSILTPTGIAACDIYLMDRNNVALFMEKVDQNDGSYRYYESGSRQNFNDGTVQVRDVIQNDIYLGFKNPSTLEGIQVAVEVVAVVEQPQSVVPIITEGIQALIDNKKENDKRKKDIEQAVFYGNLGWKAYERGDLDNSLELSLKALELNPNLGWVHNNIGLVKLLQNNYMEAVESYSMAIELFRKESDSKRWFNASITDLNELINKHGEISGARDLISMFEYELNR